MCNIFVPNLFILGAGHWGHFPLVWASNQLVARSIRYKGHLYKGQLDKIEKCTMQFIKDASLIRGGVSQFHGVPQKKIFRVCITKVGLILTAPFIFLPAATLEAVR